MDVVDSLKILEAVCLLICSCLLIWFLSLLFLKLSLLFLKSLLLFLKLLLYLPQIVVASSRVELVSPVVAPISLSSFAGSLFLVDGYLVHSSCQQTFPIFLHSFTIECSPFFLGLYLVASPFPVSSFSVPALSFSVPTLSFSIPLFLIFG